jgi:hypothetical protein
LQRKGNNYSNNILIADYQLHRYAMTLRVMLTNLRRKIGLQPGMMNPPPPMPPQFADNAMVSQTFQNPAMPFSVPDTFSDKNINNSAAIPLWIQEQVGFRVTILRVLVQQSFFRVLQISVSLSTALMEFLSTCPVTSWQCRRLVEHLPPTAPRINGVFLDKQCHSLSDSESPDYKRRINQKGG